MNRLRLQIDELNQTVVPNPELQLANTAAGIAGFFMYGHFCLGILKREADFASKLAPV